MGAKQLFIHSQRTVSDASGRHADDETAGMHVGCSSPVSHLCCLVDKLVKGRVDVIGKLDLGNGLHALESSSNGKAHDSLFRQRSIEDSVGAKVVGEAHGAAEDAPKRNILAKEQHAVVGGEGMAEGRVDGLEEVLTSGLGVTDEV